MPLKFECNQDPRKMKTIGGKKFCEVCRKNVYDVRRKSVDKIVQLKKDLGTCCVVIYKDQLHEVEQRLAAGQKHFVKNNHLLPVAAGIAALSLSPSLFYSQTNKNPGAAAEIIHSKNCEGIEAPKQTSASQTAKKILFQGQVIYNNKKFSGGKLRVGYYTNDSVNGKLFFPYLKIECDAKGRFSFEVTEEELKMLRENEFGMKSDYYFSKLIECDLNDNSKKIKVELGYRPGRDTGII
jgi:hypothetical protein